MLVFCYGALSQIQDCQRIFLKRLIKKKNCFIYGKSDRYTQFNKSNILLESILKEKKAKSMIQPFPWFELKPFGHVKEFLAKQGRNGGTMS